jgi:hypothetical protein
MEDWKNLCKLHNGKRLLSALLVICTAILSSLKSLLQRSTSKGDLEIGRSSENKLVVFQA